MKPTDRMPCTLVRVWIIAIAIWWPATVVTAQQSSLPPSGSGKVFVVMPEEHGIIINFDDPSTRPNGGKYPTIQRVLLS